MRPSSKKPTSSDASENLAVDYLVDEETIEEDAEIATFTSDPLDVEASEPPGADTEGLDAAPTEIPTRVGAGSSGDLTGMSADEAEAIDEEGADGSDIVIADGEEDPDHAKDLVDLMVESAGGEDAPNKL
jgi:hypothetical protein